MRYAGQVYNHCKSPNARALLLIEMLGRTMRHQINDNMKGASCDPKEVVGEYLKKIFAYDIIHWLSVSDALSNYFGLLFKAFQMCPAKWLIAQILTYQNGEELLFQRIKKLIGFKTDRNNKIKSVEPKVKKTVDVLYAKAELLCVNGNIHVALKKFQKALKAAPLNPCILRRCAFCAQRILSLSEHDGDIEAYEYYIKDLYKKAIFSNPSDTSIYFEYGTFLIRRNLLSEGEQNYINALQCDITNTLAWNNYRIFLKVYGNKGDLQLFDEIFVDFISQLKE